MDESYIRPRDFLVTKDHWRRFYMRKQFRNSNMDLGGQSPNENWPRTRELRWKHLIVLEEMAHYKYNLWKLIELSNCFKDGNGYFFFWKH